MNAVVATPELRITLEPTRTHPRLLIVTRHREYTHASLMVHVRKLWQSLGWLGSHDQKRVWMHTLDGEWSLHIGDGAFSVSEKEANRLRDELGIAMRGAT